MSTFAYKDHQGKALGLIKLMLKDAAGRWLPTEQPDLFLVDFDGPARYRMMIDRFHALGSKVALYPHGAWSHLAWDGLHPVHPDISGYLAQSLGEAHTMSLYGYPHPIYITGWHWCPVLPMREPQDPRLDQRVLFAPIHPLGNGYLNALHHDANQRAFKMILEHWHPRQISVRCIGRPEDCGLWRVAGVEYHSGALYLSTDDILASDVVVSYGTFAYLAAACGIPTVMMGQDYALGDGEHPADWRQVQSWELYREHMRHPVQEPQDLYGSHEAVLQWRALHIGEQATELSVGQALQSLMDGAEGLQVHIHQEALA